tara:strand:+ start:1026 stop:1322 length:297 start_codon:yes stop_codon:yes gene_type:complete
MKTKYTRDAEGRSVQQCLKEMDYYSKKIGELASHRKYFREQLEEHESLDYKSAFQTQEREEWEATYSALHIAIELITERIDEYDERYENACLTYPLNH